MPHLSLSLSNPSRHIATPPNSSTPPPHDLTLTLKTLSHTQIFPSLSFTPPHNLISFSKVKQTPTLSLLAKPSPFCFDFLFFFSLLFYFECTGLFGCRETAEKNGKKLRTSNLESMHLVVLDLGFVGFQAFFFFLL